MSKFQPHWSACEQGEACVAWEDFWGEDGRDLNDWWPCLPLLGCEPAARIWILKHWHKYKFVFVFALLFLVTVHAVLWIRVSQTLMIRCILCICIYICICVTRWVRSEWLMTMPASLWMGASQTLLTSVLGVRDAIFTTNVWEELLTSVWKSGTSLRFYILAQPTPLWCYVSFEKARSPLYAKSISISLFLAWCYLFGRCLLSLSHQKVWWSVGNRSIFGSDGNLATSSQETEMVDGCLLRQLCRKCRHIKIFTGWISGGQ